jgi:hypothetical protein
VKILKHPHINVTSSSKDDRVDMRDIGFLDFVWLLFSRFGNIIVRFDSDWSVREDMEDLADIVVLVVSYRKTAVTGRAHGPKVVWTAPKNSTKSWVECARMTPNPFNLNTEEG